jgi:hypothetical protein
MIRASSELQLNTGLLLAVPIPEAAAAEGALIQAAVMESLAEADKQGISGAEVGWLLWKGVWRAAILQDCLQGFDGCLLSFESLLMLSKSLLMKSSFHTAMYQNTSKASEQLLVALVSTIQRSKQVLRRKERFSALLHETRLVIVCLLMSSC